MVNFKDINPKLCHYCGICVAICPVGALSVKDDVPYLSGDCINCGLCYRVCSGIEFSYIDFGKDLFGTAVNDDGIGNHRVLYFGHSTDPLVRSRAASGGVVTAILLSMLAKKKISAAIVVGVDESYPWMAKAMLAFSKEDIINSAQSKYSITSLSDALKSLKNVSADVAFVGLPCQIHGIRKLQKIKHPIVEKIKYCIGLFCGSNMKPEATTFLLERLRVKREDIDSLEYRGGKWPGGFCVRTKSGKEFYLRKDIYNYLQLIFTPHRCFLCPDLSNEFADLSVADAWYGVPDEMGWSTIIARTAIGSGLLKNALDEGFIKLSSADMGQIKRSHGHLVSFKKRGFYIRRMLYPYKPNFGLSGCRPKIKDMAYNLFFLFAVFLMRNKLFFNMIKNMPLVIPIKISRSVRLVSMRLFRRG